MLFVTQSNPSLFRNHFGSQCASPALLNQAKPSWLSTIARRSSLRGSWHPASSKLWSWQRAWPRLSMRMPSRLINSSQRGTLPQEKRDEREGVSSSLVSFCVRLTSHGEHCNTVPIAIPRWLRIQREPFWIISRQCPKPWLRKPGQHCSSLEASGIQRNSLSAKSPRTCQAKTAR